MFLLKAAFYENLSGKILLMIFKNCPFITLLWISHPYLFFTYLIVALVFNVFAQSCIWWDLFRWWIISEDLKMMSICCSLSKLLPRDAGRGGQGQFLADQWTLFQPSGQIMPTTLLPTPQIFGRCCVSVTLINFLL